MSGLFKTDVPDAKIGPSKDDERQRQLALLAKQPKGGKGTTVLTSGLATPSLTPAGSAPRTTALTG
tara:strand:+ start:1507 stop:1704 length:198 start_codon:yes stop_codon:yes gene_type:complete